MRAGRFRPSAPSVCLSSVNSPQEIEREEPYVQNGGPESESHVSLKLVGDRVKATTHDL